VIDRKPVVILPFTFFFFLTAKLAQKKKNWKKSFLFIAIFSHALMREAQMLISLLRLIYDELPWDYFYIYIYIPRLNLNSCKSSTLKPHA
jgi:hypothetical protein